MALTPRIKDNDWTAVRQAIAKITRQLGKDKTPTFSSITLSGLTASRLIYTNASGELTSTDLDAWIEGTPNQVYVTDDGDGTITLSGPQDLSTADHPTFDYINLSTSQGVTGLTTTDYPTFDHITLAISQGITGLTVTDHPTFDYIVLSTSQGVTGLGAGDHPTFDYINLSTSQGITGLTVSDSPTFNNLTLTGTFNGRQVNPDADNTYDIGESDRRWRNLYLGTSITLVNQITEFSTDGTLGGNSDLALPSEKAVKTYVDAAVGGVGGGGMNYVDRGDPSAYDFWQTDLTTDEDYHDLDLSGIIPVGTYAVNLKISINTASGPSSVYIRKKGNANGNNNLVAQTQVASVPFYTTGIVPVDGDRLVEYWASNVTWAPLIIHVLGWFIEA